MFQAALAQINKQQVIRGYQMIAIEQSVESLPGPAGGHATAAMARLMGDSQGGSVGVIGFAGPSSDAAAASASELSNTINQMTVSYGATSWVNDKAASLIRTSSSLSDQAHGMYLVTQQIHLTFGLAYIIDESEAGYTNLKAYLQAQGQFPSERHFFVKVTSTAAFVNGAAKLADGSPRFIFALMGPALMDKVLGTLCAESTGGGSLLQPGIGWWVADNAHLV